MNESSSREIGKRKKAKYIDTNQQESAKRPKKFPLSIWNINNDNNETNDKQILYNPIILGDFSLSKEKPRKYHNNAHIPLIKNDIMLPIDLNLGFDAWHDDFKIENLDNLLHWICENNFSLSNIQLITYRGLIKKIAISRVDCYKNHWCMRLSKVGCSVLMDEIETDQNKNSKLSETHQQRKFTFYGHQFEKSMLDHKNSIPIESDIVVTSKIGDTRCIFAAEVDGKFDDGQIVELKTHRVLQNEYHINDFQRKKLMNTFMQCFLAGVKNAYFGFRDKHGFVHQLKNYEMSSIENMCQKHWNKEVMLLLLSDVLNWVIPLIESDKVYHMSYLGSDHITLELVDYVQYVPDWFIEFAKKPIHENDN